MGNAHQKHGVGVVDIAEGGGNPLYAYFIS